MPSDQIQPPRPQVPPDLKVVLRVEGPGPRVEFSATIWTLGHAATCAAVLESIEGLVALLNPPPVPFDREDDDPGVGRVEGGYDETGPRFRPLSQKESPRD